MSETNLESARWLRYRMVEVLREAAEGNVEETKRKFNMALDCHYNVMVILEDLEEGGLRNARNQLPSCVTYWSCLYAEIIMAYWGDDDFWPTFKRRCILLRHGIRSWSRNDGYILRPGGLSEFYFQSPGCP